MRLLICLLLNVVPLALLQAQSLESNVTLVSDYRFRGLTQTDGHPALQGGLSLAWKRLTLGIWGSPVNFRDGGQATAEVDVSAGVTLVEGLEVGGVAYLYPGSPSALGYDFFEIYATWERGLFSASLYASPEFFGRTGAALYGEGHMEAGLPGGFQAVLMAGYQYVERGDSYAQATLALRREMLGLILQVAYVYPRLAGTSPGLVLSLSH